MQKPSANHPTACREMVDGQHDHGADDCHEHAVEIEAGDASSPKLVEEKATDDGADDTQHDVKDNAFAFLVDDLAGDEARDEAENDPPDDRHRSVLILVLWARAGCFSLSSGCHGRPSRTRKHCPWHS